MIIHKIYSELFSINNILRAWQKFRLGKTRKYDVVSFQCHLEDNLFSLYEDLKSGKYKHSRYEHFQVFDSKKRDIHKAKVRDRIVHQIIFDYLEEIFEPIFIRDSYSSRKEKGSHQALKTFKYFAKLVSNGNKSQCYILKCDVRKYFNSVKQKILLEIIRGKVTDESIFEIIREIVNSFKEGSVALGDCLTELVGMPLGNITSQVFANIYLNGLDEFVKEELGSRFYIRYNDDFVILDNSKLRLEKYLPRIRKFLEEKLELKIPAEKTSIRKLEWGVDFLGYIILKDAVLLRNKTKGKIFERLNEKNISSYLGLLKHCNSYTLRQKIISNYNSQIKPDFEGDF